MNSEFINLISSSNLSKKQKEIWIKCLAFIDEDGVNNLTKIIQQDPKMLEILTHNLIRKMLISIQEYPKKIKDQLLSETDQDIIDKLFT